MERRVQEWVEMNARSASKDGAESAGHGGHESAEDSTSIGGAGKAEAGCEIERC